MSDFCPDERAILEASREGRWSRGLSAHVAQCSGCGAAALVAGLMQATEPPENNDTEIDLEQAERIWWRAQMASKRGTADRALRPIALAETLACLFGAVVLAALTARYAFPAIHDLREMAGQLLPQGFESGLSLLGLVAVLLALSTAALWIALIIGFGTDRRGRTPS